MPGGRHAVLVVPDRYIFQMVRDESSVTFRSWAGASLLPALNCFSSRFGAWARLVAAATHVTGRSAAAISGTTYRESDGKRRPRLGRRAHLDASPMDEHDFPRDVQTQAQARGRALVGSDLDFAGEDVDATA